MCARVAGFSLHAAQRVVAGDRTDLERLWHHGLRGMPCPPRGPTTIPRRTPRRGRGWTASRQGP
jgi:hypothetical protein